MIILGFSKIDLNEIIEDLSRNGGVKGKLLTLSRYSLMGINSDYYNQASSNASWSNRLDTDVLHLTDRVLFQALGFETFEAIDYSDYENTSFTYDLNNPNVPEDYCEKYDYIMDCGTLEHIFNLPNALTAIFRMLKVGGTFWFTTPIWYAVNHGFYNFSPCLFSEYFSQNKWQINKFQLYQLPSDLRDNVFELYKHPQKLDVSDENIRSGIIAVPHDTLLVMWGSVTKTQETVCATTPSQPYYVAEWKNTDNRNAKLMTAMTSSDGSMVWLYGAGLHTIHLLETFKTKGLDMDKLKGILSLQKDEIGKRIAHEYDLRVSDISAVKQGDTIIISSKLYEKEIYDRIKHLENNGVKIVTLYL